MIVVIQCAAIKRASAGHLITTDGKPVHFFANPRIAPAGNDPSTRCTFGPVSLPHQSPTDAPIACCEIIPWIIDYPARAHGVSNCIGWYDDHTTDLIRQYEAIDPAKLYDWLLGLIPEAPGTVLDIGAGTGRDAAWFAGQGHDVIAVEPSSRMRAEEQHIHADPRIRWIDDQLPELGVLGRLGISFDLVMLNAVW